jgi:uncharacterized protein with GYD domain
MNAKTMQRRELMPQYVMLGKYSAESLKRASPPRTRKTYQTVQRMAGKIKSIHALLGVYDLMIVVDFPTNEIAMEAVVTLSQELGIGFTTCPAIPVEQFDRMLA